MLKVASNSNSMKRKSPEQDSNQQVPIRKEVLKALAVKHLRAKLQPRTWAHLLIRKAKAQPVVK